VGLFARDDEYPSWIKTLESTDDFLLRTFLLGIGIAYLVTGKTAGRIVGICLIVAAALGFALRYKRRRAGS
jgi:hypothetical protein